MNWYKISTYIHELDRLKPSDDIEENITNLHELQFKGFYIQNNPGTLPQESINQIINKFNFTAWPIFEQCRQQIIETYDHWLEVHPIQNPETWAEMVINSMEESYGSTWFQNVMQDGIDWGQLKLDPETIANYINRDVVINELKEDFYNNPEAYEYRIEQFLDQNVPKWRKKNVSAIDFVQNNDLSDKIEEYIFSNFSNEDLKEYIYEPTEHVIDLRKAIIENLYKDYMYTWGVTVEGIIEEIEENRNGLNNISQGSTAQEMAQATSLAVGVMHSAGNIMQDYGYGDLSSNFLNLLHEGLPDQKIWEAEMKEEFGVSATHDQTPLDLQRFR